MEAIVLALLIVGNLTMGVTALGPHQEAAVCDKVAITSDRTGEVLYYNCR